MTASCLDCFFSGRGARERKLSKKPSASLILNHESSVIDTTAKEASLSIATGSNGSWTSTWILLAAEIIDLRPPTWLQWLPTALWIIHKASSNSTASGCSMAHGGSIASGGNMVAALTDLQHQHGFWLQLGPWISTRPQPQQGQDSASGCCALSAPWHRLPSWLTRHDHHVCSIASMSRFPSQQGEQAAWVAVEVVPPLRKAGQWWSEPWMQAKNGH